MKYILIPILFLSCASQKSKPTHSDASISNESVTPSNQQSGTANSDASISSKPFTSSKNFVVPLSSEKWYSLEYSSIPENKVTFNSNGIHIQVRSSASPLIYSMSDHPLKIQKISIKGTLSSLLNISSPEKQGEKGLDDFNLRLGLVLLGKLRLSGYQRLFAAAWVKKLFTLAPKDQGIEHIYFLNGVLHPNLVNQTRAHPLSGYIHEHYAWLMDETGSFNYTHTLSHPKDVVALWISSDGDDTASDFDLQIENITLSQ